MTMGILPTLQNTKYPKRSNGMEKYGFVYIWRDSKHKRFYIGSHWGTIDDGYICSSNWMRDAYRRRPGDFNRRILSIVKNRSEIYEEEQRWLDFIKREEIGKRYYNLIIKIGTNWAANPDKLLIVSAKLKGLKLTDKHKQKLKSSQYWIGKKRSAETRNKITNSLMGKKYRAKTWKIGNIVIKDLKEYCISNFLPYKYVHKMATLGLPYKSQLFMKCK